MKELLSLNILGIISVFGLLITLISASASIFFYTRMKKHRNEISEREIELAQRAERTLMELRNLQEIEKERFELATIKALKEVEEITRAREELERARAENEEAIRLLVKQRSETPLSMPLRTAESALYLAELEIHNVRCIKHVKISFLDEVGKPRRNTILLGDNSSGKSTILRCLALALCSEADAAALIPAWSGEVIRHGDEHANIRLSLVNEDGQEHCQVEKTILRAPDGSEVLRQNTKPEIDFKWNSVFLCAYGTQRTATATQSFDAYSTYNAVSTLFDDEKSLQNPELVLLRQSKQLREILATKLAEVMLLDPNASSITGSSSQLKLSGPWGESSFSALSDGFRSTSQWLLDLFAWSIYSGRLDNKHEPDGIVLIDELEQHLHPRWQRYIIQRINKQFPKIQFVVTTHTPLVASGAVDVNSSMLVRLNGENEYAEEIDPESIRGYRADQVFSEVFGLPTTRNPNSSNDMNRWTELRAKRHQSEAEKQELMAVESRLKATLSNGETLLERTVESAINDALDNISKNFKSQDLSLEIKHQLRELIKITEKQ